MSQLDDAILDSLTHVTFPKGFAQAEPTVVVALLHDAPLVLLDEPTEGLDATTESQILELLAEMMHGKTVLMVTHRLRGLSHFQQIIVMDNGQIIEQGSHAELLARQGRYYPERYSTGGEGSRRKIDSAVTLLPEPDSPTSASVSPDSMCSETSFTTVRTVC